MSNHLFGSFRLIQLPLIGSSVVRLLVNFCENYTRDHFDNGVFLPLSLDNWAEVYEAAEFLQMEEVGALCIKFVEKAGGIDDLDALVAMEPKPEEQEAITSKPLNLLLFVRLCSFVTLSSI